MTGSWVSVAHQVWENGIELPACGFSSRQLLWAFGEFSTNTSTSTNTNTSSSTNMVDGS